MLPLYQKLEAEKSNPGKLKPEMKEYQKEFLEFAIQTDVLRFGEFVLKSGRSSPFFFNAGLFNTGASLSRLGEFYADRLLDWGESFDVLFGPAYKGIPLVASAAMALAARTGRSIPFSFNRKETKDHGEGGITVGAQLRGRVVIIDDVVTAGISVDRSIDIIEQAGARPICVCVALDRLERSLDDEIAATRVIEQRHGIPVLSIADLNILVEYLAGDARHHMFLKAIKRYSRKYGAA